MRFPFKNSFKSDSNEQDDEDESSSRSKSLSKKVFALIHKEKWDKIIKILKGKYGSDICGDVDQTGLTILGMAVGSNPPLQVIELILKINPSLASKPDSYGALPIHLACLNGASSSIIKFLIDQDNGATVRIPDEDQRVPLHHAVEFSARLDAHENSTEFNSNFSDSRSSLSSFSNFQEDLEIIVGLCDAAPELVRCTDKNGDTPIDVAHVIRGMARTEKQHFRVDKVYHILRNASIEVYKREKKLWERQGYDVSFGEVKSREGSCETETITSWSGSSSTGTGNSRRSLDAGDIRFACSDEDLDIPLELEDKSLVTDVDTRYRDRSKMKYFGFS